MGEDVESVMGGVRMGVNVDIKRTDGEYILPSILDMEIMQNIETAKQSLLCCWLVGQQSLIIDDYYK